MRMGTRRTEKELYMRWRGRRTKKEEDRRGLTRKNTQEDQ